MPTEATLEVEVKILDVRLKAWGFPASGSELAAGFDLFACISETLRLFPQQTAQLISSGMSIRIADPDWCALIMPRSGLGHSKGLVLGNSIGIVDPDYEGVCQISAWNRNPGGGPILINPGDRIAQMLFVRIARPRFKFVNEFGATSKRGEKGWGSSGA